MRIVSTVPSQTELLFDFGLDEEVVGITKFCIHPEVWFRNKQRVGGTKTLDIEKIKLLRPDWVLANKEENIKEQIEACKDFANVYVSDIHDLDSALKMINEIGSICNRREQAAQIIHNITSGFLSLHSSLSPSINSKSVVYLIWKDPLMTVGQDTFIHDMIIRNGWINLFADRNRYPETDIESLQILRPDFLLLSSEPYPFTDKHIAAFQEDLPHTQILLVDGTYFSWYGSRLKDSIRYFEGLRMDIQLLGS